LNLLLCNIFDNATGYAVDVFRLCFFTVEEECSLCAAICDECITCDLFCGKHSLPSLLDCLYSIASWQDMSTKKMPHLDEGGPSRAGSWSRA